MAKQTLVREFGRFALNDPGLFIKKALQWACPFQYYAYFTSNDLSYLNGPFPHFMAVGAHSVLSSKVVGAFDSLRQFYAQHHDWCIGYLTYELKNDIENLISTHPDTVGFDGLCFFQPEHLIWFKEDSVEIQSFLDPQEVYNEISILDVTEPPEIGSNKTQVKPKVPKARYIHTIKKIKEEIVNGEVYELNYCMEFTGNNRLLNPVWAFQKLNQQSPMPFAVFQRFNDKYLISASPERFLRKSGTKLISQPIKGTIARGTDSKQDNQLRSQLFYSEKERAENMMIVDLVRNDLAKSAVPGTVKVEELFGIYSYEKVHQMVSTVSAEARPELSFVEIIKNAFPMGSMTGAPKISAMKLIEKYEVSKRGLYSGAAGFITPEGNFDFNVVIRSLLFNQTTGNISFQVGSAITYDSVAELEYEECLLKAKAILELLKS